MPVDISEPVKFVAIIGRPGDSKRQAHFFLFKANNKLQNYLRGQLTSAGIRITIVQAGILLLLKQKDGRSMTEFSRILSTDNSAITGLVDRLEKLVLSLVRNLLRTAGLT